MAQSSGVSAAANASAWPGHDALGRWYPRLAVLKKTRDRALSLAAQGLSCARAGQWTGGVKSAIGKRLRRTLLPEPQLSSGGVLKAGRVTDSYARRTSEIESNSRYQRAGVALGSFGA